MKVGVLDMPSVILPVMGKTMSVRALLALALPLLSGSALAEDRKSEVTEAIAKGLQKKAMEEDYLTTEFTQAQDKLQKAVAACGTDSCDAKLRAALRRDLGVVQIGGQLNRSKGQENFVEALKLDPTITLDRDLETKDIKAAWAAARKRGPTPTTAAPASAAEVTSAPTAEPSWNAGVKVIVRDNNITINPIGALLGGLNVTYTRALNERLSLGVAAVVIVPVLVDVFAAGGGVEGLFWLKRPNTGVFFGPYAQMWRALPQKTNGLSMTAMAVGAEIGQRWLWENSLNLGFGGGLGYSFPLAQDTCAQGATCTAIETGLAPRLFLDLGYAF